MASFKSSVSLFEALAIASIHSCPGYLDTSLTPPAPPTHPYHLTPPKLHSCRKESCPSLRHTLVDTLVDTPVPLRHTLVPLRQPKFLSLTSPPSPSLYLITSLCYFLSHSERVYVCRESLCVCLALCLFSLCVPSVPVSLSLSLSRLHH
jgi:hypothetical protein